MRNTLTVTFGLEHSAASKGVAGRASYGPDATRYSGEVGYANEAIRREVEPVLLRLLSKYI